MPWNQNYAALNGSLLLTALVVAIPIFFLFWALAVKRMKGHVAGLITLGLTIVISVLVYRMPVSAALSASALGMLTGLFPIGWIILTAVFLFNLTVESGQFEVIKSSISSLSQIVASRPCSSPSPSQPSWRAWPVRAPPWLWPRPCSSAWASRR